MEQGLTKKLKGSDGLPVPVGHDDPKSDAGGTVHKVLPRLEREMDGPTAGSYGNADADKTQGNIEVESKQTSDIDLKVHTQVNSSTDWEANETSSNVSDNTVPHMNFIGYGGSSCEKAGNMSDCVASVGAGTYSNGMTMDERLLKRERRKQANRESARRSRLRKQAEYDELVRRWDSLNMENSALKSELRQLQDDSEKLRLENAALMVKLGCTAVDHQGDTVSDKAESDSALLNSTEKVLEISSGSSRNENPDNPETNLHQLLKSSSRTDAVSAR
ncbi:G-box-binding factor 3-like [Humulus lupulus]|uniref:G-box-binding factor 3-like n=1 Tax=Humulus lupulus TaxID=3486 RepID=UPI002B40FEA3|nr:G-box-binding factor 3-like [Humulus lupulus]XP_062074499.1 G-box-binding factor 3-like [Humulus lupulus]XP_062074500.1 G-box-binding factor 3-like [Humulus lupulus]XP_062074501.1 G-box-binding factor 3-like [Humulus lupulus]XP_062074502.1 G-box-binding factor 3-like [Humulus lupulus]